MANRYWTKEQFSLQKNVVRLFAQVTFGAAGAPTLVVNNSKGINSVTRNSTGLYTFVFGTSNAASGRNTLDEYYTLLMVKHTWDETANSGTAPLAPLMYLTDNSVATAASCSVQVKFTNSTGAAVATDPASGEQVFLEFILSNSVAY